MILLYIYMVHSIISRGICFYFILESMFSIAYGVLYIIYMNESCSLFSAPNQHTHLYTKKCKYHNNTHHPFII